MIAEGKHDAIISDELWEAAQAKRKEMGVKWNKTHSLDHEHILSGIIKCPICGTGLAGTVRRRKNKKSGEYKDDFYYRCLHRKKIDEDHFCDYKPSLNQDELNHQIEAVISDMVNDESFMGFIQDKLRQKVDVSQLEAEREKLRGQLRQLSGAKKKLTDMLDALDVNDRHYDRKYQDMQDRLDNLYDKISEVEDAIQDITDKINAVYGEHLTAQELYKVLEHFDDIYFKMSDLEKKEFFQNFIESITIYPDKKTNERIVDEIDFKFPIYYDGKEGRAIRLLNETTVETVVLLSQQKADDYIEIDLDLDEMDITSAETKATYREVQQYVLQTTGLMVSNLNIAQIKDKCGFDKRENYNKPRTANSRQPKCTPEKEKAIMDAFRHFGMI